MTSTRKLVGAAAFSLALAGGGIAGATLGTPTFSGAQDAGEDSAATTGVRSHRPFEKRGASLAVAAEALGMSEADLMTALKDGKSIAQVAEDQGVDLQTVIDALVADGMERLAEAEAALPDRITEMVNRTGWGEGRDANGGPGDHRRPHLKGLATAAGAIGITPQELGTALKDGSTIAEVAEANDVDVDTVIAALVANASAKIDEGVANGKITEERADAMKAALTERITSFVNGEHDDHPGRPGRPGDDGLESGAD